MTLDREAFNKFADDFWRDYQRQSWHSRYSEPIPAMYAVIEKHGGHVMWPKYSDIKYNVFYEGPPERHYAVHVYKMRLHDGGIYPSLKAAKLAAWDMRRLFSEDETDFAIQVIHHGRKQALFIGEFTNKMLKLAFRSLETDRTATVGARIEASTARYKPWTKGKRK